MRIASIEHLVLTVDDPSRTAEWYARVLGMRPVRFGEERLALQFSTQKINLHRAGHELEPKALRPIPGRPTSACSAPWRFTTSATGLTTEGVPVEEGPVPRTGAMGAIQRLDVRDPDGNLVELSCYDAGRRPAPWPYDHLPPVPELSLQSEQVVGGHELPALHAHPSAAGPGRQPTPVLGPRSPRDAQPRHHLLRPRPPAKPPSFRASADRRSSSGSTTATSRPGAPRAGTAGSPPPSSAPAPTPQA
jgi:catechol 2,3-dioxygenase-like lactoylglutathione lyase family enzyme